MSEISEISEKLIKQIEAQFTKYSTYYEILRVKKENLTDEIVEEAYKNRKMQLEEILNKCSGERIESTKELILTSLQNAYYALRNENARKHYEELLKELEGDER